MSRHCEVLTDDDGTVIARVQLAGKPTAEERAALLAFFKHVRDDMDRLVPAAPQEEP